MTPLGWLGRKTSTQTKNQMFCHNVVCLKTEALPGVWGNRRIRPFISVEQGEQKSKIEGNKGYFGEQGKMLILFQGNKGTGTAPTPPRLPRLGQVYVFKKGYNLVQKFKGEQEFRGTREQVPPPPGRASRRLYHDRSVFNPCPAEPGYTLFCKQCRSRSVGFWRSQLIWICTVCHQVCKFIATIWIK